MPDNTGGAIDDLVRLGNSLTDESPAVRPFIERAVTEARALRNRVRFAEIMNGELDAELRRAQDDAAQLRTMLEQQADELERRQRAFERVAALVELAEWSHVGFADPRPVTVSVADLRAALTDDTGSSTDSAR